MPRPRKHDQEAILDAVETVIARDGVLTVDAVAKEAGVSKATVLYDHPSKKDLIAAVVARTIAADNEFNAACAAPFAGQPDATLLGRIAAARQTPPVPGGNAAVLSLVSALMQDAGLRKGFRDNQADLRAQLIGDATHPRAARLAWLALEGLKYQQHLDLHDWSDAARAEILADIETLARTAQAPTDQNNDA